MNVFCGIDLGSTTTKAVLLDEHGDILGRGITNSRSNYFLAAEIARDEAFIGARFTLIDRELRQFRKQQLLSQLHSLRDKSLEEAESDRYQEIRSALSQKLSHIFGTMEEGIRRPRLNAGKKSDFFRDQASSDYSRLAESVAEESIPFELLMSIFDKVIILVENQRMDLTFEGNIRTALSACIDGDNASLADSYAQAVARAAAIPLTEVRAIGTGYGRQRVPFPKDMIRSEILCHGLGANISFPGTATVLDIGGQDTKAIQVDERGIVTNFQMNDRCAAGCGRYLGYIVTSRSTRPVLCLRAQSCVIA